MFKSIQESSFQPAVDQTKKNKRMDSFFNDLFKRQPTFRQSSLLLHYYPDLPNNLYPKSLKDIITVIRESKWPSQDAFDE